MTREGWFRCYLGGLGAAEKCKQKYFFEPRDHSTSMVMVMRSQGWGPEGVVIHMTATLTGMDAAH